MHSPLHPFMSAIVAMSEQHVIGYHNRLPWHMPADLQHFRTITLNKTIVMGRKTYQSIGHPLPQRTNFILTRDRSLQAEGCHIIHSIEQLLSMNPTAAEFIVIGGAEIYAQTLPYIQCLYVTIVHCTCPGDVYFPSLSATEWEETCRIPHQADATNPYDYDFLIWKRKDYTRISN